MIKDILIHLDGSDDDPARLGHAEALCALFESHLTALLCNPMPEIALGTEAAAMAVNFMAADQDAAVARGDAVEAGLRERIARASVPVELRRHDPFPDQVGRLVARHARAADLLVALRPGTGGGQAARGVEAAVFDGGRSVFLAPPDAAPKTSFDTILVGWDDTRESARALHEGLPFLRKASQVMIATVESAGPPEERRREPSADVARHLDRLGIRAEVRHLPDWNNPAEALVNEASMTGADLLVTGAYGHSRFLEWILGGTTRDLLRTAPLPLLMAH